MASLNQVMNRFTGQTDDQPAYLADLTLWYDWQQRNNTMPDEWRDFSLAQVSQALGSPVWAPVRPWRQEMPTLDVTTEEQETERTITYRTTAGALRARWTLGPDGDWWQEEYPVKTSDDLPAALEMAAALDYSPDPGEWHRAQRDVSADEGLVVLEMPRSPYSELLHTFLGWSDGLIILMGDERGVLQEILAVLEQKRRLLVEELALLPASIALCPDNLDGQYISPYTFADRLAPTYRHTADVMHRYGKWLVVHIGGPSRHLLAPLTDVGVDAVQGVAGPPQSNATLQKARKLAGPDLTLWGGIPQDVLLATHSQADFEAAVKEAAEEALGDTRMILGIADKVPVDAELERLQSLPALIGVHFI
jgi:hypothetical protein